MTPAEQTLAEALDCLSQAFEHLEAVEGLPALERGALLALRSDVAATIRRLGNLSVFVGRLPASDARHDSEQLEALSEHRRS